MLEWAFGPNTRLSLQDSRLLKTLATSLVTPELWWGISYTTVFHCIAQNPSDITVEGTHL